MHPWLETANDEEEIPCSVLKKLKKVSAMDNFKVFVASFPHDFDDLTIESQVIKYFKKFDVNNHGRISPQEFKDGLKEFFPELNNRKIMQMFTHLDIDGDDYIQFDEFWILISYQLLINANERLRSVFKRLDCNGNGYIDRCDILHFERVIKNDQLMRRLSIDPNDVIESADLDRDGRVSFDEFLFAMHPELVEKDIRMTFERCKKELLTTLRSKELGDVRKSKRRPQPFLPVVTHGEDSDKQTEEPM